MYECELDGRRTHEGPTTRCKREPFIPLRHSTYTLDLDSRQDYLEGGEPIHTGTVGDRANERSI